MEEPPACSAVQIQADPWESAFFQIPGPPYSLSDEVLRPSTSGRTRAFPTPLPSLPTSRVRPRLKGSVDRAPHSWGPRCSSCCLPPGGGWGGIATCSPSDASLLPPRLPPSSQSEAWTGSLDLSSHKLRSVPHLHTRLSLCVSFSHGTLPFIMICTFLSPRSYKSSLRLRLSSLHT